MTFNNDGFIDTNEFKDADKCGGGKCGAGKCGG
jgi:hypothetical protein